MLTKDKIKTWLLKFATAQAYISAISLPILAFWGLPLSLASFFGNLIASPIITIFIFISSFIFFFELFGIPNLILIKFLELNTKILLKFVQLGSQKWLIGIQESYNLIIVPIIATIIIFKFKDQLRLALLITLLFISITLVKILPTKDFSETLKCRNSKVILIKNQKETNLYFKVNLEKNPSFNSWLEYKLLPTLYKKTGSNKIDNIYLDKKPSQTLIFALKKHLNISNFLIK